MKQTTKTEYSILASIYLGRHPTQFIKINEIYNFYNIPGKYLEQLLMTLKLNGFVKSKRGDSGGYMLALSPEKISIARIIRLMDGALAPSESVSQYFYSETPLTKEKKMILILKNIRNDIPDTLEKTTLKELL